MKPLKLNPIYKNYIWGGEKLRTKYGKDTDITPLAESWELSCHKDGLSVIDGGEHNGKTLDLYIKENLECLGTRCKSKELPILIKLIDAQENLSVQVHPNDEQAKEWENQNSKTEMWYVLEADKGALDMTKKPCYIAFKAGKPKYRYSCPAKIEYFIIEKLNLQKISHTAAKFDTSKENKTKNIVFCDVLTRNAMFFCLYKD